MELSEDRSGTLKAALAGSRQAFDELAEPHRRELQVHCYRMLGSILDAEDLVQETLLRAWQKLHTFEARAPFRAWLYRIATNACLDEIAKRPKRSLPFELYPAARPGQPMDPPILDPIWIEPFPDALLESDRYDPAARFDQRESVTLAFLVALQSLPSRQRAILLLKDVLGLRANEVASLLGSSVSAVNSALYRARIRLKNNYPSTAKTTSASDPAVQELLDRYVAAWESADVDSLVALFREDATFPMPPVPTWVEGRGAIREFVSRNILNGDARGRWRLLPTRANSQPAFGWYRRQSDRAAYDAFGIQVITLEDGLIADATTFGFPELFEVFDLPSRIGGAS
ncbi:MAG: sigma-70 family RNA polymerase sigma factor [Chloroflexi bacterium]|nr:sigma-70 family RNA polymerase sigma factor [Chloroflexota bacterium]